MILASVVQAKLNLVVLQVGGVPAGHSQGPCHGRVLDQAVWPAHLQGSDVILASVVQAKLNLVVLQVDHFECQKSCE